MQLRRLASFHRSTTFPLLLFLSCYLHSAAAKQGQQPSGLVADERSIARHSRLPTAEQQQQQEQQPKRRLKILVYSPSLSWSHAQFLGKIADTLHEAGHDVHFFKFVSDPSLVAKNETKFVQKVHLLQPQESASGEMDIRRMSMIRDALVGERSLLNFFDHPLHEFTPLAVSCCQEVIRNTEMLDRLAAEHFDIAIGEMYDLCPLAIFHRIGVRTKVAVFAVPLLSMPARRFGIPSVPSFMPNMHIRISNAAKFTFLGRLVNTYNEFYDWLRMDDMTVNVQQPIISRAFGSDFPRLKDIARNVSLVLINSNPFFELQRPISNKVVHIGGLVDGKEHHLDQRSQQLLDNAVNGAVLFSFGSITDTRAMSAQMRSAIVRAFAHFPEIEFIWKLDSHSLQNASDLLATAPNVHIFEWVRQTAVLKHPNLRAFITHCGQNSLTEAARAGVPVLGIPLFGDQHFNAIVARRMEMGVLLDVRKLNGPEGEQALVEALEELLHNSIYRHNAQLIKRKLALTPFSPAERLIRWVEFAAEFPPLNELNLPGDEELSWFVYYSLDVITFTLVLLLAMTWLAWRVARLVTAAAVKILPNIWTFLELEKLKEQ